MPTGVYVRRKIDNSFQPEVSKKYIDSYVWMDYLMVTESKSIIHKLNNSKEIPAGTPVRPKLYMNFMVVHNKKNYF